MFQEIVDLTKVIQADGMLTENLSPTPGMHLIVYLDKNGNLERVELQTIRSGISKVSVYGV